MKRGDGMEDIRQMQREALAAYERLEDMLDEKQRRLLEEVLDRLFELDEGIRRMEVNADTTPLSPPAEGRV